MEHRSVVFSQESIEAALSDLALGGLRVFRSIGSTSDEALAWASAGAADLSLVIADEQTAGRGRSGRTWLTPRGSALALSAILRGNVSLDAPGRLAGLGAMAVADACASIGLEATIKWPNDVLLGNRKVAGVLVEAQWSGHQMQTAVLGIGINVLSGSTPPDEAVLYPATSMEQSLGRSLDRMDVLRATIRALIRWRPQIQTAGFLEAWEGRLAFRGQQVKLMQEGQAAVVGGLMGLEADASLRLSTSDGVRRIQMGEIHLLPTDDRIG